MTECFYSVTQWREFRKKMPNVTLGFVPTMGALHEGHASLIKKSREENEKTLVSIFINPTQFDSAQDLSNYPRTLESDLELCKINGVDFVLIPSAAEMYPDGFTYYVDETENSKILCGAHRPGHFRGMLTIVAKLLLLAEATRSYFGEKDFQQCLLVKKMVEAFFLRTEITACPIIRESDGLAMSSRNTRLSPENRRLAPLFYKILSAQKNIEALREELDAAGFKVEYVEEKWGRRLAAVWLGEVRLIDNVAV